MIGNVGIPGNVIANVTETSEPATEPVSLARAFLSASVDDDVAARPDMIEMMSGLIVAARDYCENALSRAFVRRTFQLQLSGFPSAFPAVAYPYYLSEMAPTQSFGRIAIPYPPLFSVDAITYTDNNGLLTTLPINQYQVISGGKLQGFVVPAYGVAFPSARIGPAAVGIESTAGYSADDSGVPGGIKAAMLMLTSHWFRNREATAPGSALPEMIAMGVDALLSPYQWGFYG